MCNARVLVKEALDGLEAHPKKPLCVYCIEIFGHLTSLGRALEHDVPANAAEF